MGHNPVKFVFALGAALAGLALIVLVLTDVVSGKRGFAGEEGEDGEMGPRGVPVHYESFSIAWTGNISGERYIYFPLTDWTDVVDTATCPDINPRSFYRDLSTGVLDMSAGTFTVGSDGYYMIKFQLVSLGTSSEWISRIVVNDLYYLTHEYQEACEFGMHAYLTAGDVLRVETATTTPDAELTTFTGPFTNCFYMTTWAVNRER